MIHPWLEHITVVSLASVAAFWSQRTPQGGNKWHRRAPTHRYFRATILIRKRCVEVIQTRAAQRFEDASLLSPLTSLCDPALLFLCIRLYFRSNELHFNDVNDGERR